MKLQALPETLERGLTALVGCVAGAASVETLRALLRVAGFEDVMIEVRPESRAFIADWLPGSGVEDYVATATLQATKPT